MVKKSISKLITLTEEPMDVLPYTLDHNSIMHGYDLVSGIPMEGIGSFGWYIEQDYFFEYVYPLLPNIVKENEVAYNSIK